jgi:hypothetical protein
MTERRISLSTYYNRVVGQRGFRLAPHHYPIVGGLEDARITQLLVMCAPGAGKSMLLSVVLPTWEVGHDPTLTMISVSAGESLPMAFMSAARQIIEYDPTFREFFPEVKPSSRWSDQRGLYVIGHSRSDPDPSFACFGLGSSRLTGAHARYHIYDDIHDRINSSSPESRQEVKNVYFNTLLGRADPRGVRRIAVGRWWASDDIYQEWISSGDWVVLSLPATRPGNTRLWYDAFVPKNLECVFSEEGELDPDQDLDSLYTRYRVYYGAVDAARKGFYWPGSPTKRSEYDQVKRRQPRIAALNYDGDMTGGQDAIFRESDFIPYLPPSDLRLGYTGPGFLTWQDATKGDIEQAWDTALGQPQSASRTVALTGLLVPCKSWHRDEDPLVIGSCEFHFDVYLLWAMVGDLDFRELTLELRKQYALWSPRRVIVEEKQTGVALIQTFKGSQIPIKGHKVDQGKVERAVNPVLRDEFGSPIAGGGASVQGWARMGRIRYPIDAPWITTGYDGDPATGFLKQVLKFQGGVAQVSDEFDALVHLVTRAIVKSRRHGRLGVADEVVSPDAYTIGALQTAGDPRRMLLNSISEAPATTRTLLESFHPWTGMCGAPCQHFSIKDNFEFCHFHDQRTTALRGCEHWVADRERLS